MKVPLPQLGFDEPERICDSCLEVTALVTKSRSLQMVRDSKIANDIALFCRTLLAVTINCPATQKAGCMQILKRELLNGEVACE